MNDDNDSDSDNDSERRDTKWFGYNEYGGYDGRDIARIICEWYEWKKNIFFRLWLLQRNDFRTCKLMTLFNTDFWGLTSITEDGLHKFRRGFYVNLFPALLLQNIDVGSSEIGSSWCWDNYVNIDEWKTNYKLITDTKGSTVFVELRTSRVNLSRVESSQVRVNNITITW